MAKDIKPVPLLLAVDCVVFGFDGVGLQVLLIRRGLPPFRGRWALPGGFVRPDESVDAAALRELREEAGLEKVYLEQLYTFGDVRRDPRGRIVSVAYTALVSTASNHPTAATDAREAAWFPAGKLPTLAFDHADILKAAVERLRGKVRYRPVGFELLPEKFTLSQLQQLYEAVLGRSLDKRNFRKKLMAMGVVRETPDFERGVSHRAARLYRFDAAAYERMTRSGFDFEL
jgi:8-oxo-dGTP diphosphatase